jgi:hypothetical protein
MRQPLRTSAQQGRPTDARLRALCDLRVAAAREQAGWHGYDGTLQDLSPDGVRSGLARLGDGTPPDDPHDARHLAIAEAAERVRFADLEHHRWNPRVHIANLDLGVYTRPYAPLEERMAARRRHLQGWPDAVDAACEALDRVPAVVAEALLPSARGLADTLDPEEDADALAALDRFVAHLRRAAASSDVDVALGTVALTALLGVPEGVEVDLGAMVETAARERVRLRDLLDEACDRLRPDMPVHEAIGSLMDDHPDADGVLSEARALTAEAIAFTRERGLLDDLDGECHVLPSPPSRRWATASLVWAAPYEPDGPSSFFVTPPDPGWPPERRRQWLSSFSRSTLPATTVHEAAPGHFAHGRALRRVRSEVRGTLHSSAFVEGWAHYGEELCVEEGFRAGDRRFVAGVALKALLRVVRLEVAVGVHSGSLMAAEATARFTEHAFLRGPAAEAEARRATFDPTYGRYTWGKLALQALRAEARERWRAGFTLRRFHQSVLALGAPPLGLLETALAMPGGRAATGGSPASDDKDR